jgi:hypothetical protein
MLNWLHKVLRTKYVVLLEEEVARLRAENRALLNSLLGTAGFPPVDFAEPMKPQPLPRLRKRSWYQLQAWKEAEATNDHSNSATPGYPWKQNVEPRQ